MTYDPEKVEALLRAVEIWGNQPNWGRETINPKLQEVFKAADALKPPPEMEYVLPEWGLFVEGKSTWNALLDATDAGHHVVIPTSETTAVSCSKREYNAIREATRRPKQDRVPAGKDWGDEDIMGLWRTYMNGNLREVIDAIKTKCGV